MAETTTTKPVNLYQLGLEIGASPPLRAVGPRPDGTTTVTAESVAQATLDAKVAAHTADVQVKPPVAQETVNRSIVEQRLAAAIDILNQITESPAVPDVPDVPGVPAGTMSTAQLSTAVRSLRDEVAVNRGLRAQVQQNRQGIKQVADILKDLLRWERGDFADID